MRKLTKKQKQYLDTIVKENPEIFSVDGLTGEQYETLTDMNDFETIFQETDRYLSDKRYEYLQEQK